MRFDVKHLSEYINKLMWLIYGMIALSEWSYYLLCDVLKLPFYAYEIFFIPLIFIYKDRIINGLRRIRKNYLLGFYFLLLFLVLGITVNMEYTFEQITTYRTLFYVFFFMYFFSAEKGFNITKLQILCVGASVGQFLFIQTVNSSANQTAVNIVALALMVIIPVVKNNVSEVIISSLFALLLSFRSSFRINIVIVLLALVVSLLYSVMIRKKIKALVISIVCITMGVVFALTFDDIVVFLVDVLGIDNPMSIYRITNRLEALFQADFQSSQDTIRFKLLGMVFSEFIPCLIPCGLIGKAINMYGRYKDAPIVFFYHAFGSPVTIILLAVVFMRAIKYVYKYLFIERGELAIFGLMFPLLVVLFFLNGTFIMNTYEACLTGIILGYWFNKNKLTVIK